MNLTGRGLAIWLRVAMVRALPHTGTLVPLLACPKPSAQQNSASKRR